ncbi:exopolysaccharide biosynthesis protein [Rhodohalobacter mucosus]|uniref:Exopolysaccharide biosynthesis protein n=2 Tax=Rhodohalobacter mucosus TaxID=2079485 RepID=A0A316TSX6_9BACT|nr:exopolysaccharide biosynthesis protein [Rhodohalobacter mucosus]
MTLKKDVVSLDDILDASGRKSFGFFLLLAGIITLAPLVGDIPGVPTLMGAFVIIISFQLLIRRENMWLPAFMRNRTLKQEKILRALKRLKPVMKGIDRILKPRLTFLTKGFMQYVIALICVATAAVMPVMEFIPFSANIAGVILTVFGLALLASDGFLVLFAFALLGTAGWLIFIN